MLSQVVWLSLVLKCNREHQSFMLFPILEYLHHLVWSARQSSSEWPLHPSSPRGPGWCQPLRCGRWAPVPRGHLGAAPGTKHNRVSVNWTPLCNKAWYISTSLLNYLFFPFYILQMYQLHHFHQIHIYFYWYIILERVLHVIHLRNTLCDKILKKNVYLNFPVFFSLLSLEPFLC